MTIAYLTVTLRPNLTYSWLTIPCEVPVTNKFEAAELTGPLSHASAYEKQIL